MRLILFCFAFFALMAPAAAQEKKPADVVEKPLANLEQRCKKMLKAQSAIFIEIKKLHQTIEDSKDKLPGLKEKDACTKLAAQQATILADADQAIDFLKKEGAAVAFLEVFQEVRHDLIFVQKRLAMADVGMKTQTVAGDIIDTLKEMIRALSKAP